MNRLKALRERKDELEQELNGRRGNAGTPQWKQNTEDFDHREWLHCELESVKLAIRQIRKVQHPDGGVEYAD